MKRFPLLPATLFFLMAAVGAACTAQATPEAAPPPALQTDVASQPASTPEMAPTATGQDPFPVTLTDALGNALTLPVLPRRVVSLSPAITEILFAVGAGEQVVGVTKYCTYPLEAQTRAQIGGFTAQTISVEKIVSLEPELVLAAGAIQGPVIDTLQQMGFPVFSLDPAGMDGVYASIEQVGVLTGHRQEAGALVARMQERIAAVAARVQPIPEKDRPTVFYEVWHEPLMTAGPTTFIGELIDLAGGRNLFADMAEEYPQVSAETVVQRNPAVILGPDSHGEELTQEKIEARPGWAGIEAVRTDRIYLVDGDMVSRPGPRLADALEQIAALLHPDLFQ